MKKATITQAQADAIERWSDKEQLIIAKVVGLLEHGLDEPIYTLTTKELIQALYIGYEVEPEFKVEDWVKHVRIGKVGKVVSIPQGKLETENYIDNPEKFIHATPEEIEEEKERRFFARHGREPWELRERDVLIHIDGEITEVEFIADDGVVLSHDSESRGMAVIRSYYEVVCFAESRLDVKTNE